MVVLISNGVVNIQLPENFITPRNIRTLFGVEASGLKTIDGSLPNPPLFATLPDADTLLDFKFNPETVYLVLGISEEAKLHARRFEKRRKKVDQPVHLDEATYRRELDVEVELNFEYEPPEDERWSTSGVDIDRETQHFLQEVHREILMITSLDENIWMNVYEKLFMRIFTDTCTCYRNLRVGAPTSMYKGTLLPDSEVISLTVGPIDDTERLPMNREGVTLVQTSLSKTFNTEEVHLLIPFLFAQLLTSIGDRAVAEAENRLALVNRISLELQNKWCGLVPFDMYSCGLLCAGSLVTLWIMSGYDELEDVWMDRINELDISIYSDLLTFYQHLIKIRETIYEPLLDELHKITDILPLELHGSCHHPKYNTPLIKFSGRSKMASARSTPIVGEIPRNSGSPTTPTQRRRERSGSRDELSSSENSLSNSGSIRGKHYKQTNVGQKSPKVRPGRSPQDLNSHSPTTIQTKKAREPVVYQLTSLMSKGAISMVWGGKTLSPTEGDPVIIKLTSTYDDRAAINEIASLLTVQGDKYITPLLDYFFCESWKHHVLVFPPYGGKNSYDFSPVNQKELKQYMSELLVALGYCHSKEIIHRDIKLDNVLFCREGGDVHIRLIDFGLSLFSQPVNKWDLHGSNRFMAPELFLEEDTIIFGYPIDIWAAGIIFAQKMFIRFPYAVENIRHIEDFFRGVLLTGWTTFVDSSNEHLFSHLGVTLLIRMLDMNPETRLTAADALKHPYFQDLENCPTL